MKGDICLEQFKVGIQQIIPWSTLRESITLYSEQDIVLRGMVLSIQAYVLAEEVDCRHRDVSFVFKFPSTWWQHFKQSYYPEWLLRKFPVRYSESIGKKRVIFRRLATYPKANIAIPDRVGDTIIYRNVYEVRP